jgi:hypothetical protein
MANLIDKDVLVAEIENLENRYKTCPTRNSYEEGLKDGRLIGYKDTLYKINILEVKEVDLEKVFNDEYSKFSNDVDAMDYGFPIDLAGYKDFAKHFFELGLKTK